METLPLSAFVICKDERHTLGPCLESLAACREIVVVDSGSTDGTLGLIDDFVSRGWPIRLFQRDWPGFARQKQFALEQCTMPWCLSLDADERLDDDLRALLPTLIADPVVRGWAFPRAEKLYGYGYPPRSVGLSSILRLVRREGTRFDTSALVHEGMIVTGPVRRVRRGVILHERAIPIEQQVLKEAKYAFLKATQRRSHGKKAKLSKLVFSPLFYFLKIYILNRYFLCGRAGFIHAATGALYSFLTEAVHAESDMADLSEGGR